MTFEELMETIPQHIQRNEKEFCMGCGHKHNVLREYSLKIDILEHDKSFNHETNIYKRGKRYRVYYEADRRHVIGENVGLGKTTVTEAVEELKIRLAAIKTPV